MVFPKFMKVPQCAGWCCSRVELGGGEDDGGGGHVWGVAVKCMRHGGSPALGSGHVCGPWDIPKEAVHRTSEWGCTVRAWSGSWAPVARSQAPRQGLQPEGWQASGQRRGKHAPRHPAWPGWDRPFPPYPSWAPWALTSPSSRHPSRPRPSPAPRLPRPRNGRQHFGPGG